MSIYGKIIMRVLLLSVMIAGVVLLNSEPLQALTCLEQCRQNEILCFNGCHGNSTCFANCQADARMCANECP